MPGVQLKLAPDGEILIQQPAFLGYIGQGSAPACFATGDIGHFDAQGYLYVDGRKSALLISAFGRNIAPEWVESDLVMQCAIGRALVFGDDAIALGAFIVPASTQTTNAQIALAVSAGQSRIAGICSCEALGQKFLPLQ